MALTSYKPWPILRARPGWQRSRPGPLAVFPLHPDSFQERHPGSTRSRSAVAPILSFGRNGVLASGERVGSSLTHLRPPSSLCRSHVSFQSSVQGNVYKGFHTFLFSLFNRHKNSGRRRFFFGQRPWPRRIGALPAILIGRTASLSFWTALPSFRGPFSPARRSPFHWVFDTGVIMKQVSASLSRSSSRRPRPSGNFLWPGLHLYPLPSVYEGCNGAALSLPRFSPRGLASLVACPGLSPV